MPETRHDLAVTVYVRSLSNIEQEQQDTLKKGIENLIRCAFRENTDYDVKKRGHIPDFPSHSWGGKFTKPSRIQIRVFTEGYHQRSERAAP
jgi:hypothetical protein